MHWIREMLADQKRRQLKCRVGLHVYKWSWRHLRHECIYCGKKKGGK